MNEELVARIDKRIKELGMNRTSATKKAGLGHTYVKDLLKLKGLPNIATFERLANVLQIDYHQLLYGEETRPLPVRMTPVIGVVQAGHYLDISDMPELGDETIPFSPEQRFAETSQYALKVLGDSMNNRYPEGSYVVCTSFSESGLDLTSLIGHVVHVERQRGQLVEITLKILQGRPGKFTLHPDSTNPKYKPIAMEGDEETSIAVKGFAIASYKREEFPSSFAIR